MDREWRREESPLGRILVAPFLPEGRALFYTTVDFEGRLSPDSVGRLVAFLQDRFGVAAAQLASCGQVHGTAVRRVRLEAGPWSEYRGCDALISDERHVALGIKVADCLPVTVVDPDQSVIANIHAGWRGAAANIVGRTLDEMKLHTPFLPSASSAWLGPSIRACCFEVGEEVIAAFRLHYEQFEAFVDRRRGPRPFIDLPALASSVLERAGFNSARIFDSGICTRCGTDFHSYRRDRELSGRNLAIVAQ